MVSQHYHYYSNSGTPVAIMSPPASSRPLVVYLVNTNIAADVDKLDFLEDIEKIYESNALW